MHGANTRNSYLSDECQELFPPFHMRFLSALMGLYVEVGG